MNYTKEGERKIREFLKKRREILVAYLFGSQARKTSTPMSDMDIGLVVDKTQVDNSGYGYRANLCAELMQRARTNDIDVVILNDASPLLAHRVVHDGIMLHSKDEAARISFEVKTLKMYIDTKPLRKVRDMYLKKNMRT